MESKRFLLAVIILYVAVMGSLAILRHESFNSTAFDLAVYDQTTWQFSQLKTHEINTITGTQPFADHATPILFIFAILYWIYSNPITLLIAQTIIIALGALPIYWMARKKLGEFAGKCLALAYLLYPSIQYINLFDFHPDALIIPLLLFAFHSLEEKDYRKYFAFLVLAGACKEYAGITIAAIGIYALLKKQKWAGIATIILGIAWLIFNLNVLMPAFGSGSSYNYLKGYEYLGSSFGEIIRTIITNPLLAINNVLTAGKTLYIILLLAPVAGLAVIAPEILMALPGLAIILLQKDANYTAIIYQHNALVIPFIFIAAIYGAKRIAGMKLALPNRRTIAMLIVAASVTSLAAYGPLTRLYDAKTFDVNDEHAVAGRIMIKQIPAEASVSATTYALPHLSHRKEAYMFPNPIYRYGYGIAYWETGKTNSTGTDYVLIDTSRKDIMIENISQYNELILSNENYKIISNSSGWILLRKK